MPGLCGIASLDPSCGTTHADEMLEILAYGRASVMERCRDNHVALGCAHLGTGGQRALYDSPRATVVFYGYLTRPAIPPGSIQADPAAAAHYIHDQFLERQESILKNLMGAFAFALWDKRSRTLLLANDRLGMRPIYYTEHKGMLRFASEVKALLVDPSFPHRLDLAAASDFFHFRYILGDRTFLEDIRLLPPASYLRCWDGCWSIARYWEPEYPDRLAKHPDQWYDEQIYRSMRAAVERMVRPNLSYGITLSSGMDSRWIAAILSEIRPDTQAFTFGGAVTSDAEFDIACRVAALTGLKHHRHGLSPLFVADYAERMAYITDGMHSFVDSQEFPLSVELGNHVDVAVGGFMGSGFFGQSPIYHYLRSNDVYSLRKQQSKLYQLPRAMMERVFRPEKYGDLLAVADQELRAAIDEAPARRGFQMASYEGIRQRQRRFTFYAQLLKTPYVDMYHPIADNEIWELSMQLPPSQLVYKRALRRALGTYYPRLATLPWNKAPGPATVPAWSILVLEIPLRTRQLVGKRLGLLRSSSASSSHADYAHWLRGPLKTFVEDMLLSPEANATGLFDRDGLREVVLGHMEGRQDATAFLGLALPFELWTRLFYTPATPLRPANMAQSQTYALVEA